MCRNMESACRNMESAWRNMECTVCKERGEHAESMEGTCGEHANYMQGQAMNMQGMRGDV